METILSYIMEYSPTVGAVVLVLGVFGAIVYKATMYNVAIQNTMKKVDELPCDEHRAKIDKTGVDIADIKNTLRFALGKKVPFSKRKSPLSLNEEGIDVVKLYNLDAMIDSNWVKINSALQGLKTKNPYDVQVFCIETAFGDTTGIRPPLFFTEKDIDKLKILSFKTGEDIFAFTQVMGILIRDRFFKENGIDVDTGEVIEPDLVDKTA